MPVKDLRKRKTLLEELSTEEMQRVPEIQALVSQALLHSHIPSNSSTFAVEKAKPRLMRPVRIERFEIHDAL